MILISRARHEREMAGLRAENERLNDELTAACKQLDTPAPATDVVDAHRQALAGALGYEGGQLSWDELIAEADRRNQESVAGKAERQHSDQPAPPVGEDDLKAISDWGSRVRAHDRWKPTTEGHGLLDGVLRPTHPALELRRTQERCRALEARLAQVEGRPRTVSGL